MQNFGSLYMQLVRRGTLPLAGAACNTIGKLGEAESTRCLLTESDDMQVLNSQSQAGSSGRHLNISITGAASPAASADGTPTITGTIADTSVDTGPRSVDVQVHTP